MKADHFEQQKLLDLAAEDVALTQLAHRQKNLPEVAAVTAAEEAERSLSADVVRAETEVKDLGREVNRLESDVETVRQREAKDQRLLESGSVSPKEMTNLQHELDSLKRRQGDATPGTPIEAPGVDSPADEVPGSPARPMSINP